MAFNRVYASFFDNLHAIPIGDRNCLWLAFTDAGWREVIVGWDETVGRMVAEYRAAMAKHIDDPAWQSFVDRLHRASPEFTGVWERQDVLGLQSRTKRAMHPLVGLLRLDYTNLWLDARLGTRIVTFTPADKQTAERLQTLYRSLEARRAADAA